LIELNGGEPLSKNLKLKSARAAKDMSQKDVADAVGVTRQTINAIENGDYNPTINLCIAICKVLGKTLNDLFWEEESNE
jgi:putative transcriptional regulator